MKKMTLILALLMVTKMAIGQTDYDILPYFSAGDYNHVMMNVMQMHDESIVANIKLVTYNQNTGFIQTSHGWYLLKVTRDCSEVLDTVMIEDPTLSCRALMEPTLNDEGYIFANIKRDGILPKNYLSICRFDEDLVFDLENEIRVPLEDSVSLGYEYLYLDDNDIILYYPIIGSNNEFVLSRFGTDGNLKHRQVIADSLCPINQPFGKIKVWNESPKKYVANGKQSVPLPGGPNEVFFRYCVLDSLFGIEEVMEYDGPSPGSLIQIFSSTYDDFESLDDSTYIFTTEGRRINTNEDGIQVTRRDKRTHTKIKTVFFPHNDPTGLYYSDQIIGIQKSSDNSVYVAFFNNGIVVTKMDMELNILWQRRYNSSTQNEFGYMPMAFAPSMRALEDGGLAIGGNYMEDFLFSVFVFTLGADGTSTPELETFLHPYLYYPNPTQDQLHLQYSPDVQPKAIELYDLQGRLVSTQSHSMENVDMQGLAPGQYLMKVTLQDGKSYTDKVVKE